MLCLLRSTRVGFGKVFGFELLHPDFGAAQFMLLEMCCRFCIGSGSKALGDIVQFTAFKRIDVCRCKEQQHLDF